MYTIDTNDDDDFFDDEPTVPAVPLVRKDQPTQRDLEKRLEQAVHILVNCACRRIMKEKAATLRKPAKKTPKTAPEPMSEIHTSPDFCLEAKGKSAPKRAQKPSEKTRPAKDTGGKPSRSKGVADEVEEVGGKS